VRHDSDAEAAPESTPPEEEPGTTDADAGSTTKADGGTTPPPPKKDAGTPPKPDAGPTQTSGSITVTCPSSGFHKGPPITIASIPTAYLPRCSSATRACYLASTTSAAGDACLDADTSPPATVAGGPVDCKQCERSQGSYCLASSCETEFTAYACCAQAQGDAACTGLLNAVTSCAGTTGKTKFATCLNSLVPLCFE
jgi:hypothetical protein